MDALKLRGDRFAVQHEPRTTSATSIVVPY